MAAGWEQGIEKAKQSQDKMVAVTVSSAQEVVEEEEQAKGAECGLAEEEDPVEARKTARVAVKIQEEEGSAWKEVEQEDAAEEFWLSKEEELFQTWQRPG